MKLLRIVSDHFLVLGLYSEQAGATKALNCLTVGFEFGSLRPLQELMNSDNAF